MISFSSLKMDIESFQKKYDFSIKQDKNNMIFLYGKIHIIDPKEGFIWDSFQLIYFLDVSGFYEQNCKNMYYPDALPKVFLNDHKEMKSLNRHINDEGLCCLTTDVEASIILGKNYTLIEFTEKLVIPFFAAQILFDKTGQWPNGDYSHGPLGKIEYYAERLCVTKDKVLLAIKNILFTKTLGRNDLCFCDSGKKFKKCHLEKLENFSRIANHYYLNDDYEDIKKYCKTEKNREEISQINNII